MTENTTTTNPSAATRDPVYSIAFSMEDSVHRAANFTNAMLMASIGMGKTAISDKAKGEALEAIAWEAVNAASEVEALWRKLYKAASGRAYDAKLSVAS